MLEPTQEIFETKDPKQFKEIPVYGIFEEDFYINKVTITEDTTIKSLLDEVFGISKRSTLKKNENMVFCFLKGDDILAKICYYRGKLYTENLKIALRFIDLKSITKISIVPVLSHWFCHLPNYYSLHQNFHKTTPEELEIKLM